MDEDITLAELVERAEFLRKCIEKTKPNLKVSDPVLVECLLKGVEMPIFNLNKVYISDSKIAGRGLFASRKISSEEIITLYPPHNVVYDVNPHSEVKNRIDSEIVVSKNFQWNDTLWDYAFRINPQYRIVGDPRIIDNTTFLGHMINDGVRGHSTKTKFIAKDKEIYDNIHLKVNNCLVAPIEDVYVAIIAYRDIEPNEEILMYYGYEYWTTHDPA